MGLFPHDPAWTRHRVPGTVEWAAPDLVLRRFALPLLPAGAPALRLAFLSDLHWDGEPARRLDRLTECVAAARVDAVVFGGDLAAHLVNLPAALRRLADLAAGVPVRIAVRGNRESVCTWLAAAFWRERYAQAGFRYLHNEVCEGTAGAGALVFAGLDDLRYGAPDLALPARAAASGRAVVTVTHNPDAVAGRGAAFLGHLVLSGHTHGGQYRLPWLGAVFTSSRYWRQFDHGWRRRRTDGTLLYVTAGAGETGAGALRRRLFCPAELVLLDLEPVAREPALGAP